jgi:hypothetical protein
MKTLCIYHANCADGLGAAWAVHRALGADVEFVAAKYGDTPPGMKWVADNNHCRDCDRAYETGQLWPDEHQPRLESTPLPSRLRGCDVMIVDFSYPLATLRAMAAEARSVLVLDHHKTARDDLIQVRPGREGWKNWLRYGPIYPGAPKPAPDPDNLGAIFDMERSGAALTWDYFYPGKPRPRIIDLIEDRDLWRFRYGDESRAFHAALTSYDITDLPAMFDRLDKWHNLPEKPHPIYWWALLNEGHAILRAQRQAVAAVVKATRRTMRIGGHVVPVANVPPTMASDAGHLMCNPPCKCVSGHEDCQGTGLDQPLPVFSATYYDGTDEKRHFSLRSPPGGADVSAVAKQYGGGGHEYASGFDMPIGWEGEP